MLLLASALQPTVQPFVNAIVCRPERPYAVSKGPPPKWGGFPTLLYLRLTLPCLSYACQAVVVNVAVRRGAAAATAAAPPRRLRSRTRSPVMTPSFHAVLKGGGWRRNPLTGCSVSCGTGFQQYDVYATSRSLRICLRAASTLPCLH